MVTLAPKAGDFAIGAIVPLCAASTMLEAYSSLKEISTDSGANQSQGVDLRVPGTAVLYVRRYQLLRHPNLRDCVRRPTKTDGSIRPAAQHGPREVTDTFNDRSGGQIRIWALRRVGLTGRRFARVRVIFVCS